MRSDNSSGEQVLRIVRVDGQVRFDKLELAWGACYSNAFANRDPLSCQ